jgi:hypothetical protein
MKALITGASSGMGRDMALILSQKYDELVLVARNKERLEDLKNVITKTTDTKVKIISMDLSNIDNIKKLHSQNKDVDLLINNAGFGDLGYFSETDLEKDLLMINTNVVALHTLTKLYLKDMLKNNKGHILNVASIAGFMPGPLMASYYATKNYVVNLSESIREELKHLKTNVKISILCPGPVNTNFFKTANFNVNYKFSNSFDIAYYALNHLNKFYIMPTFTTRFSKGLLKIAPKSWVAKFIYKFQSNRK